MTRTAYRPLASALLALALTWPASTWAGEAAKKTGTLFDDLGGEPAMVRVIDGMLDRALADPQMAPIFEHSDMDRLKKLLFIHTCHIADGPCEYDGQDMRRSHDGLGIRTIHFNKLVQNMQDAMDDEDIPFRTQNKLLARLAPFHDDVTGRSPIPPRKPRAQKPNSHSAAPHASGTGPAR
jgi:hemoglobin